MTLPLSHIVPSAPPPNVTAEALSSTNATVAWGEVPAIDRNGIVTVYEVLFEPMEAAMQDVGFDVLENTTELSITVSSLAENVLYNVSVRAFTNVGGGPHSSPPVMIMTNQSSMSCHEVNVIQVN